MISLFTHLLSAQLDAVQAEQRRDFSYLYGAIKVERRWADRSRAEMWAVCGGRRAVPLVKKSAHISAPISFSGYTLDAKLTSPLHPTPLWWIPGLIPIPIQPQLYLLYFLKWVKHFTDVYVEFFYWLICRLTLCLREWAGPLECGTRAGLTRDGCLQPPDWPQHCRVTLRRWTTTGALALRVQYSVLTQ